MAIPFIVETIGTSSLVRLSNFERRGDIYLDGDDTAYILALGPLG